jgi:predicted MPP superfamily phosphohydrolase
MGGARVFYPAVANMRARFGKFGVLGNHDVWEGEDDARRGHEQADITLLENANVRVETGRGEIVIAGLEDLYTGAPDIGKAAEGIEEGDVAILLSHNPDAFAEQFDATPGLWDAALSGHTHGGQISFFGFGIFVPSIHGQRYRTAWRVEHGVPVLVSNGVGTVGAPIRFQAPPEVHVITLHSKGRGSGKPLGRRKLWTR